MVLNDPQVPVDVDVDTLEQRVRAVLDDVRPHLHVDGGDIEFVSISCDRIVEVRFLGACATCSLSIMTLRAGIERAIQNAIPEIRRIEMV